MLVGQDLRDLADDIRRNGLHEPIWLYEDPERGTILLDGRNRRAACAMADLTPTTRTYAGTDPIGFVVSENIRRRHLNAGQLAFLAAEIEPLYAAEAKRRQGARTDLVDTVTESLLSQDFPADLRESSPPDRRKRESTERAATAVGASGRAVSQAKRVAVKAPDLAEKVRSGEMAIDRADRVIRDREAEQKRVAQARREAEALPERPRVDIRHGDFREVLTDLRDIDAVITDPPYPFEFLPLLEDLAAWSDKVLKPDGVLAVLIGQTYLPEVYRLLSGGRPYRWTACYLTPGRGYVSHPRHVQSNWKPLIVYGGGPRFTDIVRTEGADADAKNNHKWGQDYSAFHTIVERLTSTGQTVVDPFMGSGTTLLAAFCQGRHAIGCDVDADAVGTARARLA